LYTAGCGIDLMGVARGVTTGVGCGGLCLPSSLALIDCRMAKMFFANIWRTLRKH
jgi:hypothetical protein